jgi:hypothetical protein
LFRIYDGREAFFQWDLDRKLIVDDDNIKEVHFCNRTAECALPVATYKEGELTVVNVPNLILQESFRINVYAYDGEYTKHMARFEVIPRSKPDTYVYTETEIKTWDELYELVKQIEENGVSDATIEAAVQKYLEENDINVDLTGYATEEWVNEQIRQIELTPGEPGKDGQDGKDGYTPIKGVDYFDGKDGKDGAPGKDGEDYILTEKDKQEIAGMVEVTGGGTESVEEIHVGTSAPTQAGIKLWVDTDAEPSGADVDLSNYYTKTEVDNKIEEIELTPGPAGKDGKDGQDGAPGKDGVDGKDYVLTEADKQEIAGMVEVSGEGGSGAPEVHIGAEAPTGNEVLWIDTDEEDVVATKDYVREAINTALSAIGIAEEGSF